MQFRVLGPLEVDAGDGPVPLGGPKQRTVLANLLVRANEVVPADALIGEVWGEEPPGKARNTLQTYVSSLRKALGDGILIGRDPGYVLVVDPSDVDANRFTALVREARKALPVDPRVAIDTLEDALDLWRGPALADVADRSLLAEAARLDELRLEAQEERIGALLATGSAARAISELEPLLARHPLRERLWEQLMLALYRDGRQAEALAAFQRAREVLADELGIDPSPELARLHGQILAQDPSLELRGEPLRGYRLLEKLGETRAGIRFRAIQPRVERDVEIEVFHEDIASTQAFVERFEPEAQAVAALEHPHIVPIYDYWREPGRAYLVHRFLRGPSLAGLLERGEHPDRERASRLIEQIASALALAHRQQVAHGDVDAANVLLDEDGNAYLGGFAIGTGPRPSRDDDIRRLASLVRQLLGADVPGSLADVIALVDGPHPPDADAFVRAAAVPVSTVPTVTTDHTLPNPYRGLRAFTEADAPDFFGRAAAVRQIIGRLAEPDRFLAVVGPSGSGKSSLVRAGVVPALRAGALDGRAVLVTELSPGPYPFDELETALARIAIRPLRRTGDLLRGGSRGLLDAVDRSIPGDATVFLVVDQFEELFTMTTDEAERTAFLESLRVACADPESRVRVIVTLRADFYDRPLVYPRFGELLASGTEAIAPLRPDELEQAIRAPAERSGLHPEPGLVAEMIADAAHQPGALPLIQFTLTELFDRRTDDGMTLQTYREFGGIVGTLATSADEVVERADRDERRAIRQIFLRLVALGEGRQDTRRRIARGSLDALDIEPSMVDAVLATFGRLRILTFDREPSTREPTVEIAHEALLDAWPRLRAWIDDAREDLRIERGLHRATAEWVSAGQDPSFLLRGARLEHAEAWLRTTDLVLPTDMRRYVAAGVVQHREEQRADVQRRAHEAEIERRSARRLRGLVAVFAAAALVAGSLTLIATDQSRRAEREAGVSAARELAAASLSSLDEDPERAVLLAIEAVERSRALVGEVLPGTEEALHRAIAASRVVRTIPGLGGSVATSQDGRIATERLDHPGDVAILDADGEIVRTIKAHRGDIEDVALTPDGRRVITFGADGWLRAWEVEGGQRLWQLRRPSRAVPETQHVVSLDASGSLLAAGWPEARRLLVADARTGAVLRTFSCFEDSCQAALRPDGELIAIAAVREADGVETGWIMPTIDQGPRVEFRAPPYVGINGQLAWSPDGRYLSGSSFVWSTATGERLHTAERGFLAVSSGWSPDGSRLVTGSGLTANLWEIGPNEFRPMLTLTAGSGSQQVTDVAFSSDGERVVTASDALRLWDVRPLGSGERASLPVSTEYASGVAFIPENRLVVTADVSRRHYGFRMWDLDQPTSTALEAVRRLAPQPFDVNPVDGSIILLNNHRSVTLAKGRTTRQLPILANHAAWTRDGTRLVVTPTDHSVALVDLDGNVEWRTELPLPIGTFEVAPDGRVAVDAGDQGASNTLMVLDGVDGSPIATLTIPSHATAVALDPQRDEIVTTSEESGPLEVWDLATEQLVGTYPAETSGEPKFAFSPDGSTLAVMGVDQVVRLYDVDTRQLRLTLPPPADLLGEGPGEAVGDPRCHAYAVAFSGDGSLLAVQGCAGVRVFTLDVDELLGIARANVTRTLSEAECQRYLHRTTCLAE